MTSDLLAPEPVSVDKVNIVDTPEQRVRRLSDLLLLLATMAAIALVLLMGVYARGTTAGITDDVHSFAGVLAEFVGGAVSLVRNFLSGAVTLAIPATVVIALAIRKDPRKILESLGALVLGIVGALGAVYTTNRFGSPELIDSLTLSGTVTGTVVLPAYIAGVASMLTASGRRDARAFIKVSWNVLWVALAVSAISGFITIPGALATVLIGRTGGLLMRYLLGTATDRAYGAALVRGIELAGFAPRSLVRVDPNEKVPADSPDLVSAALGRSRQGRVYDMTTVEGHRLVVVALDGDQQVASFLSKWWRTIRLRGLDTSTEINLRHNAESTALVSHAARTAGVHTARVLSMAKARDTMILIYQRPHANRCFADLDPSEVTDEIVDAIWHQVNTAHAAGITHRSLTSDTVLISDADEGLLPTAWLASWEIGEVASSSLAKRMDRVQIIAMLAVKVGARRAVASAFRSLSESEITSLAPLLQTITLPRTTRIETRKAGKVLQDVRNEILEHLPEVDVQPENIVRFGIGTVVKLTLGVVALGIVLTFVNLQDVVLAIREASPGWIAVSVLWALCAFVGAAMAMHAFSPIKLPFMRVLIVQVAASYLALVAPAGVGPAALNLRMLTKRGVHRPLAVATVALVQVSSIVVTVLGLLMLSLVTGSGDALKLLPSDTALLGVGVAAAAVVLSLTVPKVRAWVLSKTLPMLRETWPRLVQILGQPWRLAMGLFGNLLVTASFVGALHAALTALGIHLALVDVVWLFLLSNAAGAAIPTPGGVGPIEGTLITGLSATGVITGVATSATLLYRLVTFWVRMPLGYVALNYLQRKGEL